MLRPTVLILVVLTSSPLRYAAGLSTTLSEVKLEHLQLGHQYSLKESGGVALTVVNTGDEPVELIVDPLLATQEELKPGYEPLPDLVWVAIVTNHFTVPAAGTATSDILISIPNDSRYRGKRYQCYIWSHTIGHAIGVGLKSRVLLSVSEEP